MEIKDSIVILTGGARIGQEVALSLAQEGAAGFLLTYLTSKEVMEELATKLRDLGAKVILEKLDTRNEEEVNQAVDLVLSFFSRIDILINMASTYVARKPETLSLETWRDDYDNNATNTFLFMNKVAPIMRKQGQGRIINFVDWTAASRRTEYPRYSSYYAAKQAVIGLTEAFALDYAPEVLINSIAPGPIIPPVDLSPELIEQAANKTPLKRWGGSAEIAEAVKFFIRTNFVTGECLRVDGGRHLV
jgi:NAD(P)-dependent dehydrogenase (short-subunit alcohol dehydrogenase family)